MSAQPEEALVALTPAEAKFVQEVHERARKGASSKAVLAEAIRGYRAFVLRSAVDMVLPPATTRAQLVVYTRGLWEIYAGSWVKMIAPVFANAYKVRQMTSGARPMPAFLLNRLAEDYAMRVGGYFHETSSAAVLDGFSGYVNRKLPPKLAAQRALEAFGVTPRTQRALIALETAERAPRATVRALVDPRAKVKGFLARQLEKRIGEIATEETFAMSQEAQQLVWVWEVKSGALPQTAQKVWVTARDERVCPVCGPMHLQKKLVTERFELKDGTLIWSPGVHPKCRCRMRLVVNTLDRFGKALGDDPFDRDRSGRFARRESRVKEREDSAAVDSLSQAMAQKVIDDAKRPNARLSRDASFTRMERKTPQRLERKPLTRAPERVEREAAAPVDRPVPELKRAGTMNLSRKGAEGLQRKRAELKRKAMAADLRPKFQQPARTEIYTQNVVVFEKPLWGHMDPYEAEFDETGRMRKVVVTEDEYFTDSQEQILQDAYQNYDALVTDILDNLEYGGGARANFTELEFEDDTGQMLHPDIEMEYLYSVIADYGINSNNPTLSEGMRTDGFFADEFVPVGYYTDTGEKVLDRQVHASEIVRMMGLHPEEFIQNIILMEEGYEDAYADQPPRSSLQGDYPTSWTVPGNYTVVGSYMSDEGVPVRVNLVRPDVPMKPLNPEDPRVTPPE